MDLGDRIREKRKAARLSQERLAYAAGISPRELRRIEAGTVTPRPSTLLRLATALGVEPDFFGHPRQRELQGLMSRMSSLLEYNREGERIA